MTNVCFVPEEKLGITILTNNDNQSFFEALRYQILDAYLGVPYTDRSRFMWGFFEPSMKERKEQLAKMEKRAAVKNTPSLSLTEFTGSYRNDVYGRINIREAGGKLSIHFEHHPFLVGHLDYMDNNEFRATYSHIGYGIYPVKFTIDKGKITGVIVQSNEFVETDAYLFVK